MRKHGFILVEERTLPEVGGMARLWRHEACGAEVLSIINSDENKCFGASFYTPPHNSTGVAHIIEHSVLCGSEKYPVREPFVELLKGSLQTFLNAFTFPDKTCYPVASANLKDFYNLIDVYLDAVFHPLLGEDTFRQEGWHLEADSVDGPWHYKGVVYNEMKGVYSQGESMLAEQSQQAVFPDNIYRLDSGGNPQVIPSLDYDEFRAFYNRCYHPSNARFFFWGDDPEDERLRILAQAINGATALPKLPKVPLQAPFTEPCEKEGRYPAAEGEDRAMFTINWLLGERGNVEEALKMEMLEHILEGLPGSPLRKALMESGLGEDTIGCGLETDLRQMYYSTGLKGIQKTDIPAARKLVFAALAELAEKGIDRQAVDAAVNSAEFSYRENNSGRFPRGLSAMIQSLSTWLYGGDPLAPLAWEKPLTRIKEALAKGEKVFENAIRENFLNNGHVTVTLLPDNDLAARRVEWECESVLAIRDKMTAQARKELVASNRLLEKRQLAPDNPADIARIPALKISDLPKRNADIPMEVSEGAYTSITHDLPTNGIVYASLLMPVTHLPRHLAPLLPLYARSLLEWGTKKRDYSQLGMRIAATTGGVGAGLRSGLRVGDRKPFLYFTVTGKAVYGRCDDLLGLFEEILLDPQEKPEIMLQRLALMIPEDRARLEYSLQAAGHTAASMRVAARYSQDAALSELTGGISQLRFLNDLETRLKERPDEVLADFGELRRLAIGSSNSIIDVSAEGKVLLEISKKADSLMAKLPVSPGGDSILTDFAPMLNLPQAEGFLTPGQVNYVAKGANLYDTGFSYHGSATVISRWLRMGRLWEEVRVAGGAYGVFCGLDRFSGTFVCSSYRDPNVDRTLAAYDGLGAFLRNFSPAESQISQAVIGAVGDLDTYLLPDARASRALGWYLAGLDKETRQRTRTEMLETSAADFRNFADVLEQVASSGAICALGGSTVAEAAKRHGWPVCDLV